MTPPPVLTDDFKEAMFRLYWLGDRRAMSTGVFYFWQHHYHPIEDEL